MKKFRALIFNKKLLLILLLSVCGGVIYTKAAEDPLIAVIVGLEKLADDVLVGPSHKEGAILFMLEGKKDIRVALKSPELKKLTDEMFRVKAKVEKEAELRKTLSLFKDKEQKIVSIPSRISSLVEVMNRYLVIQKRLYVNLMRNAHQVIGQENQYNSQMYAVLNLKVSSIVGTSVELDDRYRLLFNFWHVADENRNYDKVELGMTPQDKDALEERVLRERLEVGGEKDYAKLIHFLALRQRITNQWAVSRVSNSTLVGAPSLDSCGENFLSIGHTQINPRAHEGDYFVFLEKNDDFSTFRKKIDSGLVETTFDRPIIDDVTEKQLVKQFLYLLPKFEETLPDMAVLKNLPVDEYKKELFEKTTLGLSKIGEDDWKQKAKVAILNSSLTGDSFYREDVADRISWIAFKHRKELLIQKLLTFAENIGIDTYYKESDIRVAIENIVNQHTSRIEKDWRRETARKAHDFLMSNKSLDIEAKERSSRFENEIYKTVYPAVSKAAKAQKVKDDIKHAAETQCWTWRKSFQDVGVFATEKACGENLGEYVYAYLPSKGNLTQRIYPWTPDQLKQFFEKKWSFWMLHAKEKKYNNYTKSSKKISERVKKVVENKAVMKWMRQFFAILAQNYNDRLEQLQVSPKDVGPGSQVLADVMQMSVDQVYDELQAEIESLKPRPVRQPKPGDLLVMISAVMIERNLVTEANLIKEINAITAVNKMKRGIPSTHHPFLQMQIYSPLPPQPVKSVNDLFDAYSFADNLTIIEKLKENKKYAKFFTDKELLEVIAAAKESLKPNPESTKNLFVMNPLHQRALIDETGVYRQKLDDFPKKDLEAITLETSNEVLDLFREAMSLLGMTDATTGKHTFAIKAPLLNQRAETPRQLETVVADQGRPETEVKPFSPSDLFGGSAYQNPTYKQPAVGPLAPAPKKKVIPSTHEDHLYGQITRSILDQKMMAEVIYAESLNQNPILTIQRKEDEKEPPALEYIVAAFNSVPSAKLQADVVRMGLLAALDKAAKNINYLRPVQEACYAKPFDRGHLLGITQWGNDPRWARVFNTATAYRGYYRGLNKRYEKLDAEVMKYTKTWWNAVKDDILSPFNRVVGHLFLIALAIAIVVFTSGGGLALIAAGGGWSTFVAGGLAMFQGMAVTNVAAAGAVMTGKAIAKKVLKTFAFKLVNYLFFAELALSGYATHWEMQDQLKYKLGIANTQIGMLSKEAISRKDIAEYVQEIHAAKRQFKTTMIWTAAFFSIPVYMQIRNFRRSLGIPVKNALKRESQIAGNEIAGTSMVRKTLKENIKAAGEVRGRYNHVMQNVKSWWNYGRITSLTEKTVMADLVALAKNHLKLFFKTPEEMKQLYILRLQKIMDKVARARNAAANTRLMEAGANGFTRSERLKAWLAEKITGGLYRGKYFKIAMDKYAMKILQDEIRAGAKPGEMVTVTNEIGRVKGKPSDAEIRALCMEAYADELDFLVRAELGATEKGLMESIRDPSVIMKLLSMDPKSMNESTYLMRKLLDLEMQIKDGFYDNLQPFQRYLKGFDENDVLRHGLLVKMVIRDLDKPFVSKVSLGLSNKTKDLAALTQVFKDFQTLMKELTLIEAKVKLKQAKFEKSKGKKGKSQPEPVKEGSVTADDSFSDLDGEMGGEPGQSKATVMDPAQMGKEAIEEADFEVQVTGEDGVLYWKKVPKSAPPKTDGPAPDVMARFRSKAS